MDDLTLQLRTGKNDGMPLFERWFRDVLAQRFDTEVTSA